MINLIFDLDNTLYFRETAFVNAIQDVFPDVENQDISTLFEHFEHFSAVYFEHHERKLIDFELLKKDVRKTFVEFNEEPFQKRNYNRRDVFQEEKKSLRRLPPVAYEISSGFMDRKVYPNCHLNLRKNFYSDPHA